MLKRPLAIAHSYAAKHYYKRGDFSAIVGSLGKVIRLFPNSPSAYCDRAVTLQAMGDYRDSLDDFDRAIEIAPGLAIAYFGRGISWKILGNYNRAVADQAHAIALEPNYANAYGELGVVYGCMRDFDRAIASLTTAINLNPRQPIYLKHPMPQNHLMYRGFTQFYRGDFEAAAADLRPSLDLGDDASAMLFHYLARARTSDKAIIELKGFAKKLKSRQWPAAMIGLYLGELPMEAALAAVTNSDQRAEAQFYLGEWHLLQNNPTEAVKALQSAVRLCPTCFSEHIAAVMELQRLA